MARVLIALDVHPQLAHSHQTLGVGSPTFDHGYSQYPLLSKYGGGRDQTRVVSDPPGRRGGSVLKRTREALSGEPRLGLVCSLSTFLPKHSCRGAR